VTWLEGIKALAGVRKMDWLINDNILPNEQRDSDNNTIYEKDGKTPKKHGLVSMAVVVP